MIIALSKSLAAAIEKSKTTSELYGIQDEIPELIGEMEDRILDLEDGGPKIESNISTIIKQLKKAISEAHDVAEYEVAMEILQPLPERIIDRMREMGDT